MLLAAPGGPISITIAVVVGVLAAVIAGLAGILIARRQFSGKVTTAPAATLFEASESLRHDFAEMLRVAETKITSLEAEIMSLRDQLLTAERRIAALSMKIARLQGRVTKMQGTK